MNGVVERLGGRLGGPEGGCERVAQVPTRLPRAVHVSG